MSILRKLLPILAAFLYVVSPVDALPDIVPGLGWIDDLAIVLGLLWYLSSQQGRPFPWDVFRGRMGDRRRPASDGPRPEDVFPRTRPE